MKSCSNNFELKEGDFLFQDLDSSPICDAIELVTPGYNGANISHIGMLIQDGAKLKVLEAIPPKVILTEIDSFLQRSTDENKSPKVFVGRLKDQYKNSIEGAILFAKKQVGIDYDDVFLLNNNRYYCSELIYESFAKDSVFELQPMTFINPDNSDTLQAWKDYYSNLKVKIPENQPGINPGIISLSEKIEIIHIYGQLQGMKN